MVASTIASLFVTICCAYPLSVPGFKGAKLLMPMCIITMYFSGGLIPTYIVMSRMGLVNNRLAIILPGALSVYNMIVMRTYFKTSIPNELRESASLDGCGNIRYLVSVVLPLSGAVIAVIALFCAVGSWNSYFSPMIYLKDRKKYPLTLFIREILIQNNTGNMENATVVQKNSAFQPKEHELISPKGDCPPERFFAAYRRYIAGLCEQVERSQKETRQQLDEDILAFVNENITNNQLSIRMLAMHYGRSKSYLSMRFKEKVGMTFSAYVEQMRIQLASRMLAESGSSITEISECVGYNSSSAFGRAYKRVMGCTPSEYQASLGGE